MDFGSILLAALGIGLLIFLHELGHFLAARAAGVRVEVFSLGFGPRIAGFVWRGTDFRLSAVPFGGFVMVAGQDESDRRYPARECLYSKSVGQRALFWSGGVVMNLLFALVVFPLVFRAGVKFEAPVVGVVAAGSAAWEAGIEPGERVLEVGGKSVYSFQNVMIEVALHGGRPVALLLEAVDGTKRSVTVHPHYSQQSGLFELGVEPAWEDGATVVSVDAEGPAAAAGVRVGDRLQRIAGDRPSRWKAGEALQPIALELERDGTPIEFEVAPRPQLEGVPPLIGVTSLPIRIEGIRPGSVLVERLGLQRGDRVLAIDGRAFLGGELRDFVDGPAEMSWLVLRDGQATTLRAAATPEQRAELERHVALGNEFRLQVKPSEGGAAAAAGVRSGDWIVAIDGVELGTWERLRETVHGAGDRPLRLRLLRPDPTRVGPSLAEPSGEVVELTVTPQRSPEPDLGFGFELAPRMTEIRAQTFGEAVRLGTVCSLDLVKQLYVTLKRLVTGEVGAKNLGGIIRISQVSYQAAQRGPSWFWYFLALLSVNLGFVNLLPIPVLDGGHLLFLLIEKVKGSPVSSRVLGYSQVVGLVFVLLLVLFVTYNDILRLL